MNCCQGLDSELFDISLSLAHYYTRGYTIRKRRELLKQILAKVDLIDEGWLGLRDFS
jgi:hypothetical protein